MPKFKVLREHEGDRFYREHDEREIPDADAAHLVQLGVLAKMDEADANKAEPAPSNKGAARSKAKAD